MVDHDLIQRLAYGINEQLGLESIDNQLQLHRAELKRSNRPRLFNELKNELREGIEALRVQLGINGAGLEFGVDDSGMIRITKEKRPFVKASISVPDNFGNFEVYYNSGPTDRPLHSNDQRLHVSLDVNADDTVIFLSEGKRMTPSELADAVLEKLFAFKPSS
jgi:hypothetical protein